LAAPRRNGLAWPKDWSVAFAELDAVARAPRRTELATVDDDPRRFEEIDTTEAAARLGLSRRCVQDRCSTGRLPARRVGRIWLVRMERSHVGN
jgi:excisionase family DNA binding protein